MSYLVPIRTGRLIRSPGRPRINAGHPLARGLRSCYMPHDRVDRLVDIADSRLDNDFEVLKGSFGTPSIVDLPEGRAIRFDGTEAADHDALAGAYLDTDEGTVFFCFIPRSLANIGDNTRFFLSGRGTATGGDRFYISADTSTGKLSSGFDATAGVSTTHTLTVGKVELAAITWTNANSAGSFKIYADGAEVGSHSAATDNVIGVVRLGGLRNSTTAAFAGEFDLLWCGFWNRAFDAEEIAAISAQPYALIRPRLQRLFFDGGTIAKSGTAAISAGAVAASSGQKNGRTLAAISAVGAVTAVGQKAALDVAALTAVAFLAVAQATARFSGVLVTAAATILVTGLAGAGITAVGAVRLEGERVFTVSLLGVRRVGERFTVMRELLSRLKGRISRS